MKLSCMSYFFIYLPMESYILWSVNIFVILKFNIVYLTFCPECWFNNKHVLKVFKNRLKFRVLGSYPKKMLSGSGMILKKCILVPRAGAGGEGRSWLQEGKITLLRWLKIPIILNSLSWKTFPQIDIVYLTMI